MQFWCRRNKLRQAYAHKQHRDLKAMRQRIPKARHAIKAAVAFSASTLRVRTRARVGFSAPIVKTYAHRDSSLFLACKRNRLASKTKHYDKKHRNAAVSHLSHSCWNHYAFSRGDRRCCHGSFGSRNWHFDFGRQIGERLQLAQAEGDGAQRCSYGYATGSLFRARRRRLRLAGPRCQAK